MEIQAQPLQTYRSHTEVFQTFRWSCQVRNKKILGPKFLCLKSEFSWRSTRVSRSSPHLWLGRQRLAKMTALPLSFHSCHLFSWKGQPLARKGSRSIGPFPAFWQNYGSSGDSCLILWMNLFYTFLSISKDLPTIHSKHIPLSQLLSSLNTSVVHGVLTTLYVSVLKGFHQNWTEQTTSHNEWSFVKCVDKKRFIYRIKDRVILGM